MQNHFRHLSEEELLLKLTCYLRKEEESKSKSPTIKNIYSYFCGLSAGTIFSKRESEYDRE